MNTPVLSRSFRESSPLGGYFEQFAPEFRARQQAQASAKTNPYRRVLDPRNARRAKKASTSPEVLSTAMLRALLEYAVPTQPELRGFLVAARNRQELDPVGQITLRDLEQFQARAKMQGLHKAAATFDHLRQLAERGELRKILAGEQTLAVRKALLGKLRKFGAAAFNLMDKVIDRQTGRAGQIVDYFPDSKNFLVAWSHWEVSEKPAGELMKTAQAKPENKKAKLVEATKKLNFSLKSQQRDSVTESQVSMHQLGSRVMQAADAALQRADFVYQPKLRFIGFSKVEHAADGTVKRAQARVQVRVPTQLGPVLEWIVPVPVENGKVQEPVYFLSAGKVHALDRDTVAKITGSYRLASRPRNYRPYGIPSMMNFQDTNVRGPYDSTRKVPLMLPGEPAYGGSRLY